MLGILKAFKMATRGATRYPCLALAEISDGRAFAEEGYVKDLSETGARVALKRAGAVPNSIEIYIPSEKIRARCNVRWRKSDCFGVEFADPIDIGDKKASPLDAARQGAC